jgi:hypothetical protein
VDADVAGDADLADFYRRRFREEFQPAFDAWMATDPRTNPDAPLTPFEMPEYSLAEGEKAVRLNDEATAFTDASAEANRRADDYMLAVVLFASCLFFAGMSTKLRSSRQREVLLVLGSVVFVVTVVWIATLPISVF